MINEDFNSSDDMVTNILNFIDQKIPNQEFSIIGFSYGGYLAQGVLHKRQDNVKSICLLAPALHLKQRNLPEKIAFVKDASELHSLDSERDWLISSLTEQSSLRRNY